MKITYRYIIRSYAGPLVLTFAISLFILVMQFLWKYVDDLVGKGLDWFIILELLFYATATFVPLALPLAILFASLMTFGNLGEKYELVAMKAAGISLNKAMKPLVFLSLFISMAAFFFSNNVLPVANLKMYTLLNDVRQKKPAVNIRPGIFYSGIEGVVIKIARKERDGKGVEGIMIYDYTNREASRYNGLNVTTAEKGYIELSEDERYMTLTLFDGTNYFEKIDSREQYESRPLQRSSFVQQMRTIDLSAFAFSKTNEEFFKDDFRMLSIKQLDHTIDSMFNHYYSEKEGFTTDLIRGFRNMYADTLPEVKESPQPAAPELPIRKPSGPVKGSGSPGGLTVEAYNDSVIMQRRKLQLFDAVDQDNPEVTGSSHHKQAFMPLFPDSILPDVLSNFSLDERRNILTTSLQLARSGKENMNSRAAMLDARIRLIRKYEIEWHRKFTLSFACLILFFIGAPLGAIIRKGGLGMPAVVSVVLFIVFHVLSMTGDKLARESSVTPAVGMWMASLIILPVGIFLTVKATSDAALLDLDTYGKWWKKLTSGRKHDQHPANHQ